MYIGPVELNAAGGRLDVDEGRAAAVAICILLVAIVAASCASATGAICQQSRRCADKWGWLGDSCRVRGACDQLLCGGESIAAPSCAVNLRQRRALLVSSGAKQRPCCACCGRRCYSHTIALVLRGLEAVQLDIVLLRRPCGSSSSCGLPALIGVEVLLRVRLGTLPGLVLCLYGVQLGKVLHESTCCLQCEMGIDL